MSSMLDRSVGSCLSGFHDTSAVPDPYDHPTVARLHPPPRTSSPSKSPSSSFSKMDLYPTLKYNESTLSR